MQANNASSSSQSRPTIPVNILAALSSFPQAPVVTDGRNLHPLAPPPEAPELKWLSSDDDSANRDVMTPVRALLAKMSQLSYSLSAAMAYPISDQRVVTLYKENSTHEDNIRKAARTARLNLDALKIPYQKPSSSNHFRLSSYGLAVPLQRSSLAPFILSSIEKWAIEAKLDHFLDESQTSLPDASQKLVVSLTKEDLLVDLEFERHPLAQDKKIDLSQNHHITPLSLKSVNVHMTDREESSSSGIGKLGGTLPILLEETVHRFLREVGCAEKMSQRDVDPRRAEIAALELQSLFKEMCWIAETMKSEGKDDSSKGMLWWDIVPKAAEAFLEGLSMEIKAIKSQQLVPLDILLTRGHGLALPFLSSFSLSILLHLPPIAYLSILRAPSANSRTGKSAKASDLIPDDSSNVQLFDIPFERIRPNLANRDTIERLRISTATLTFDPHRKMPNHMPAQSPDDLGIVALISSSSSLLPEEERNVLKTRLKGFSLPTLTPLTDGGLGLSTGGWALTFGTGGVGGPLILSQARMKRIAVAIGLMSNNLDLGADLAMLGFGATSNPLGVSWLDITIEPQSTQPSRVYTALYQPNPSKARKGKEKEGSAPEVLSTLMPVSEPGLALGSVPVRTLHEVHSVIEIVKEQIWLNELLNAVGFRPGYAASGLSDGSAIDVTQEEAKAMYEALMSGSYVPMRVKPTYEVLSDGRTGIKVSLPDRGEIVTIEVVLDPTSLFGITVTINERREEQMEEVVRRGGLLALVIQVKGWRQTH